MAIELINLYLSLATIEFPFEEALNITAGAICIIVATFGTVGNMLTLLAIPWAQRNKLPGFNITPSKYTTVFIVNLAFADFLYCVINLPMYSAMFISMKRWPGPGITCSAFAAFIYFNAYAAWMSLGFVAFSRYLGIAHPKLCKIMLSKRRNVMIAGGIWCYAFLMVFPSITGNFGSFGYNQRLEKCDYMDDDIEWYWRIVFFSIELGLPFVLIVVSYFGIWRKSTKLASSLKPHLIEEARKEKHRGEIRLTWTLIRMSLLYVVFISPIYLCSVIKTTSKNLSLVCHMIYWFQYMLNFYIYAARSENYRAAYSQYLKEKLSFLFGAFRSGKRNRIFIINHRRTASNPELFNNHRSKRTDVDVKLVYSLDLQYEKIIHSYTGTIKVDGLNSPAIILLPGDLKQAQISAKHRLGSETEKSPRIEISYKTS